MLNNFWENQVQQRHNGNRQRDNDTEKGRKKYKDYYGQVEKSQTKTETET